MNKSSSHHSRDRGGDEILAEPKIHIIVYTITINSIALLIFNVSFIFKFKINLVFSDYEDASIHSSDISGRLPNFQLT